MPSAFIPDGYALTGKVEAKAGWYAACRFNYRPAAPSDRVRYMEAPTPDRAKIGAEIICRQVQKFVEDGAEDRPVTLTPELVDKLYPPIYLAILDHVLSFVGPALDADLKNSGSG